MKRKSALRSRAVLAALLALAMMLVAGAASASLATATSATYTVTLNGTTTSNPAVDDTPASVYIDKDGKFYAQTADSLYGATDPHKWSFYTGSNFDSASPNSTINNAGTNANTTTLCNNSPTGQQATYATDTRAYAEKNYCDLMGVWVDPDTGDWYGLVHNEFTPNPFGDGLHYDSIDYATSTDQGQNWTIKDHALTSPYTTFRQSGPWKLNVGGVTMCLDATSAKVDGNGTPYAVINPCSSAASQQWSLNSDGTMTQKSTGLCLDVTGGGVTSGTNTITWSCNATTSPSQIWSGPPQVVNKQANKCLTDPGSATAANTVLVIDDCQSGQNQKWTGESGSVQFPQSTYYFGDGDQRLFVDYASGYFYVFYESQVLNKGGGGGVILEHVARAPISQKMAPSSWKKWYNGTWTESGVGGKESDIVPTDATNTSGYINDAYNPQATGTVQQQQTATPPTLPGTSLLGYMNIAWDAYLGKYIGTPQNQTVSGYPPLHFYATDDLATQKWVDIGSITDPSAQSWYRWFLDGGDSTDPGSRTSSTIVGKMSRVYCTYHCSSTVDPGEYSNVTIDSTSLPVAPVSSNTPYEIEASNGQWLAQNGSSLVTTTSSSTSSSQMWNFTSTGDGFFTITNASSSQALGVDGTSDTGRAWDASATLATLDTTKVGQQWSIQSVADKASGSSALTGYRLINRYSGLALSLTTATTNPAVTSPQRGWDNTGTSGDTTPAAAQLLTFASSVGPILSQQGSNACVDAIAPTSTAYQDIRLESCNGGASQQWTVASDGTLRSLGQCMDTYAGGTTPGTAVGMWTCGNSASKQQWKYQNGSLVDVASGLCLTATGTSTDSTFDLDTCSSGSKAQQFTLPTVYGAPNNAGISDDSVPAAGNLDGDGNSLSAQALAAAGLTPGATVNHDGVAFTWPNAAAGTADNFIAGGQNVSVTGAGTTLGFLGTADYGHQSDGTLMNTKSGLCLDAKGGSSADGTQLDINTCTASPNQLWNLPDGPTSGPDPIKGIARQCVDVQGGNTADGTPLQLHSCNGTQAQDWIGYSDGTLRAFGECMDVQGGATTPGTTVQLFQCNSTSAQSWTHQTDGTLMNTKSGLCLDTQSGSSANGTPLIIWTCTASPNQLWNPPS